MAGSADARQEMIRFPRSVLGQFIPVPIVFAAEILLIMLPDTTWWLQIVIPTLGAVAGCAIGRQVLSDLMNRLRSAEAGRLAAEAEAAALVRAAGQMRHDIRGILSPALLTADRLTMSQDPASRRAGEAMVATVERAEERLRRAG